MNHIVLGASVPFLIAAAVYLFRGRRASLTMLIMTPLAMGLTMAWAVVPDIPRFIGMTDLYNRLTLDPRCDIFFWHFSIDKVESTSPLYPILFAAMCACMLSVAWRELYLKEKDS